MGRLQQTVFERNVPARSVVDHALARTRQAVVWQDDLGTPARYPRLSAPVRADVVVVGGGCTGLWTALGIKQRDPGARVLLVEGRSVGWAASGRDTGLVTA
ncbi:FAD-dependent oxidoreductase, partial [Promicromonospora kroppenstedtii]|uniref:FAD-dependent oxidoreductase n=1 Tax=Promicromonospora kroppenstedtii TaxID=440482 RepID=UPI00055E4BF5